MTHLTKFQQDLLTQLSIGPAVAVAVIENEEVDSLVTTGLVEQIEITGKRLKVVMLTDAGIAFCRNSGSNMVN